MNFRAFLIAVLLVPGSSLTQASDDHLAAHNHLLDLDLTVLTEVGKPEWQIPIAMDRSNDQTVLVQRTLAEIDRSYVLAAVYGWKDGDWRPAGWRLMHQSVAQKWAEDQVLSDSPELASEMFSVIEIANEELYMRNEVYCTDAPDTHGPDNTFGHEVGDTATYSWINPFQGPPGQGCSYESDFEVMALGNGSIGWVVIDYRFTLVDDDDGGDDGPDDSEK